LRAIDDKIELNRRLNETVERIAAVFFQAWFLEFKPADMADSAGEGLSPTEDVYPLADDWRRRPGAPVPQGCQLQPITTVAHFLNGVAMQKHPPTGSGDLPVIKIAKLGRGNSDGSELAGRTFDSQYLVNDGDLLFSWSGTLEVRMWTGGNGALNQHLFKVVPGGVPKWFVYFWLLEHLGTFRAIAAGKATTMGQIQRHHLEEALVAVPPDSVMLAADESISPMLQRIVAGSLEARTLIELRDLLLPKLLSGEIRVGEAESLLKAAV
jgi:type I restriction enzyme S subunit